MLFALSPHSGEGPIAPQAVQLNSMLMPSNILMFNLPAWAFPYLYLASVPCESRPAGSLWLLVLVLVHQAWSWQALWRWLALHSAESGRQAACPGIGERLGQKGLHSCTCMAVHDEPVPTSAHVGFCP